MINYSEKKTIIYFEIYILFERFFAKEINLAKIFTSVSYIKHIELLQRLFLDHFTMNNLKNIRIISFTNVRIHRWNKNLSEESNETRTVKIKSKQLHQDRIEKQAAF